MGWDIRRGPESGRLLFHCTTSEVYFGPELVSVEEGEAFAASLAEGDPRALDEADLGERLAAFRLRRDGVARAREAAAEIEARCEAWARAWCGRNGLDPDRWGSYRLPWPADLRQDHYAAVEALHRAMHTS